MSEALPTTITQADRCSGFAGSDEPAEHDHAQASRAAELAEALRRVKKNGSSIPEEIIDAQDSLERRIRAHLSKGNVEVTLTDNRYTMISVRRIAQKKAQPPVERRRRATVPPTARATDARKQPADRRRATEGRYEVRLHHMFVDADPVITRALAHYIAENDSESSRVLGDFIDQNTSHVRGRARRQPPQLIFTAGEYHDLRQIFDELNVQYFGNKIEAAITWGARTGRPKRRNSIKMGSYSVEDRLIRIHRSLDREFVPRFFVAWIVFHEMLHQVHDIRLKNGRREFHSKEFMADEAQFNEYDEARLWERQNLDAILTY